MLGTKAGPIRAKVTIPDTFPLLLPEVRVNRERLPHRVPHVESDGKICMPAGQGTLIDVSRPADVVADTLDWAVRILNDGWAGATEPDLITEFHAYWDNDHLPRLYSLCDPSGPCRPVSLLWAESPTGSRHERALLADSLNVGKEWLRRANWTFTRFDSAWFLTLSSPFSPPDFDEHVSVGRFLATLRGKIPADEYARLTEFIKGHRLPVIVSFSMPATGGNVVAAARLDAPHGKFKKEAEKGFGPGRVPQWREYSCTIPQPISRPAIHRLDKEFLLPRGGAQMSLAEKNIMVIGVGAIGSRLAEKLALVGVGHLNLIDGETLTEENIHRHMLGADCLGVSKSLGMQQYLQRRFPHVDIKADQTVLKGEAEEVERLVRGFDLVCIALGDETLELRLNEVLADRLPRIHAWVEPLGVGGHILFTGTRGGGCFGCLFDQSDEYGLFNKCAFSAPGQRFAETFSGCAGTFTPFSGLNADRTALEATDLAVKVLAGSQTRNALVSWFGNPQEFTKAGFRLSGRAAEFSSGEVHIVQDFANPSCNCAHWGST